MSNLLYYGDNLPILREHVADESVDLIYLDPPFNSQRNYNLLFKSPKGGTSAAQIEAFEDTWHWHTSTAEREFDELLHQPNTDVAEMMKAFRSFLGHNDMMAYLTMMANRLLELHRVLKPNGSLYLHCDPAASHYLKIVLDGVFGKENFVNEIVWKRTTAHSDAKQGSTHYGRMHDVLLFYPKNIGDVIWNPLYVPHSRSYIDSHYRHVDPDGRRYRWDNLTGPGGAAKGNPCYEVLGVTRFWRYSEERMEALVKAGLVAIPPDGKVPALKRYLDDHAGTPVGDVWSDISPINSQASERLGYPTQKPEALLARIIQGSSNQGDVVLDPFCGCGTAIHAAQKLNRKWIGIDITCLAISLIEKRLKSAFGKECQFEVHGTPKDIESARDLAERNKYQFQWWAVSLVDAQPFKGKKKGPDTGIDGLKYFYDLADEEPRKIVISVKGGKLKADDVRALNHVREREKADIGLMISLNKPTPKMQADAISAGFFEGHNIKCPRIQWLTIEGLLSGAQRAEHPDYVPDLNFKRAKRGKSAKGRGLFEGKKHEAAEVADEPEIEPDLPE
jgi:adenine specific DNA methylase Mod